ncbi:hypothetical protein [Nocardioides sp. CER19]|uniref:hypothetical protein n=1 Tax=Nocardioides sp. CER19 TaxID=3038538 RepID=UPI00244C5B1A|nr:hypothetical protein [Nocardioides sp. CER19]MDH2415976.1 hypothetical protein [Nocardioides sp. CER19]
MTESGVLSSEVVAPTRDLIRLDTTNPPGDETRAAAHLCSYPRDAGVDCELVAYQAGRACGRHGAARANVHERVHVDDPLLATRFHVFLARRLLGGPERSGLRRSRLSAVRSGHGRG